MIDSLIGFWIFGSSLCKFHHSVNWLARAAPMLLCSLLSYDFHFTQPRNQNPDAGPFTLSQPDTPAKLSPMARLIAFSAVVTALLLPSAVYAHAERVFLFESTRRDGSLLQVRIYKCVDGMPTTLLLLSTALNFLLGYALPLLLTAYLLVSAAMGRRAGGREIASYIGSVCAVYALSWLPYWASVLYMSYVDLFGGSGGGAGGNEGGEMAEMGPLAVALLLYSPHVVPYASAATEWIIYSRLIRALLAVHCSTKDLQGDVRTARRQNMKMEVKERRDDGGEVGMNRGLVMPLVSSANGNTATNLDSMGQDPNAEHGGRLQEENNYDYRYEETPVDPRELANELTLEASLLPRL